MELTIKCPKCGSLSVQVTRDGKLMRHGMPRVSYLYGPDKCDASGTQAPSASVDRAIASNIAESRRLIDGVGEAIAAARIEFESKVAYVNARRAEWEGELATLEKLAAKRAKAAAKDGA